METTIAAAVGCVCLSLCVSIFSLCKLHHRTIFPKLNNTFFYVDGRLGTAYSRLPIITNNFNITSLDQIK